MTTLRERIEARRAALLAERAIAEAATGSEWVWGEGGFGTQELVSPVYFMGQMMHPLNVIKSCADDWQAVEADRAHIAAQDPATTIARVDRELAGIDADLALLALIERYNSPREKHWPEDDYYGGALAALRNHYPEEGTA